MKNKLKIRKTKHVLNQIDREVERLNPFSGKDYDYLTDLESLRQDLIETDSSTVDVRDLQVTHRSLAKFCAKL